MNEIKLDYYLTTNYLLVHLLIRKLFSEKEIYLKIHSYNVYLQ